MRRLRAPCDRSCEIPQQALDAGKKSNTAEDNTTQAEQDDTDVPERTIVVPERKIETVEA